MNRGDLGVNADRLLEVVKSLGTGRTFADLGVRAGVSSDILLTDSASLGNEVLGVDINECPPHLVGHPRYKFFRGDSVTILSEWLVNIDLAFHDTLHIAEQVLAELFYVWPAVPVGGYCVFHDTRWPVWKKDRYLDQDWDRPEVAIERFFGHRHMDGQWHESVAVESFPESHGMTFVRKLAYCDLRGGLDWPEIFRQRNRLLSILPPETRMKELSPTL